MSKIISPVRPCSRRASQQRRPSVPAPPVTTAFPVTEKRRRAPVAASWATGLVGGAVLDAGLPVLRVIEGTMRDVSASRSVMSAGGDMLLVDR
ncbi:hypothetical protein BJX68DRAFT_243301 [Aspergillus pseudodeflectus]|uniref:Uncharacterized protein n=1 Tax=Aspergillus pseudodeflectus TaxID=176178 RepID=A0ABR4JW83_9EURO